MNKIVPVILSGGLGTRLWPVSQQQHPKQYLPLISSNTMLQETILRLIGVSGLLDPVIVCNADHRFLVAEQCQEIGIDNPTILLEPVARGTSSAIAVSAAQLLKEHKDVVMLVLSADHFIQDVNVLHQAINIAKHQARKEKLVIFGTIPSDINTGYGYIKPSKDIVDGVHKVEDFIEKPDFETAKTYLEEGGYLWNIGVFMFTANTLIRELEAFSPDTVKLANSSVEDAVHDLDFIRLDERSFGALKSDSIDYTLMEKSDNVVVIPLDTYWSDIGTWPSLYEVGKKDPNGNVTIGSVITRETTNSYINTEDLHTIVTIGIDDLVVVNTPNATLVSTKNKAQEVKSIVQFLHDTCEHDIAPYKIYRPWGWYKSIDSGAGFQVKRLYVKPRGKLSLQMHHRRAEHWVVVSGKATVTNNEKTFVLSEGESTYIPIGVIHALENNTDKPLEIVEVQSGEYLGEDDIVRFEDIYGRKV